MFFFDIFASSPKVTCAVDEVGALGGGDRIMPAAVRVRVVRVSRPRFVDQEPVTVCGGESAGGARGWRERKAAASWWERTAATEGSRRARGGLWKGGWGRDLAVAGCGSGSRWRKIERPVVGTPKAEGLEGR